MKNAIKNWFARLLQARLVILQNASFCHRGFASLRRATIGGGAKTMGFCSEKIGSSTEKWDVMDFSVILWILIGLFQSTTSNSNNCDLVQKMIGMDLKWFKGSDRKWYGWDDILFSMGWLIWDLW